MRDMNTEEIVKSGQEQAVASWVNYLNQVRLDELYSALQQQDVNLEQALATLDEAQKQIFEEIVMRDRGGLKGMHGFIAEVAECGVRNARNQIQGKLADTVCVNNNGPVDLTRNGIDIQQKFVQSGGKFSLNAVEEHLKKYPDFLKNGGKYQIPKDHFETIQKYLAMTPEEAARLSPDNAEGLSYKQWQYVQNFFKSKGISPGDIEASQNTYADVQVGKYKQRLNEVRDEIKQEDHERRETAYENSKPTLAEGAKATLVAAAIEGGTVLVTELIKKRKTKEFGDFSEDDWQEIIQKTGKGTLRGGVRGGSIYILSNFTATPAAVASGLVTAGFAVAEQAHLLRKGEITEEKFLENAQIACLGASVSALSSLIGQALIPIPILGAVVGNTVGTVLYQIGKGNLSAREQQLLAAYAEQQRALDAELAAQYQQCIETLNREIEVYMVLLDRAFIEDAAEAFKGSVALARHVGVPESAILKTKSDIDRYFLG